MVLKNRVVFYSFLVCCSLIRPSSVDALRRTRRDDLKNEHYTCSHQGKLDKNHPTGAPTITTDCNSFMEYYIDDNVYVTCQVKSNPVAKITWLFNGKPAQHKLDITSCSQKLHIPYAEVAHSGAYTCIASNRYGTVNETCQVTIQARKRTFFIINKGILINGDPRSSKAVIGSPLNMTCEIYNAHYVYWTKNGVHFPPSRPLNSRNSNLRISKYKKQMGQTMFILHLVFARVVEEDRGNYSCAGRDNLIGDTVHSYKYLEPIFAPLPAGRQASSSPSMSALPSAVYLVLAHLVLHLSNFPAKTQAYAFHV
ncbi:fibroblast growth factor receptor 3-like [Actinia tenebrosa]|uniref:Fibroblast growth factor receptor 3-like n=1 Tax=Actinia tenebrosa TaxID=6105 RepID=A0A6P8H5H8_ACTTE|nr:fibroblast growth factor receptor 3-like [Actinia tenebrosa]